MHERVKAILENCYVNSELEKMGTFHANVNVFINPLMPGGNKKVTHT